MAEATVHQQPENGRTHVLGKPRRKPATTAQSGGALFPHVVWAHFQWERRAHPNRDGDKPLDQEPPTDLDAFEKAYHDKLEKFQREHGKLEEVYWSTRCASAVAITVKRGPTPRANPLKLRERQDLVAFHRVTDWVTRDAPLVADLLHECDLLASRVEQVLRGTSQRIAMRWILGIAMHLLGFLERDPDAERARDERALVKAQRRKLADAEAYYHRAASQAGRVVYVSGMLIGLLLIVILGAAAAWLLSTTSMSARHRHLALLCYGSGAVGALVSTISRMGKPEGKFNMDFELGRPLVRRLGLFRPFVGGIFGVALFFLLASGLLDLKLGGAPEPYYFGFAAFLAGFSERFATGVLAGAEHRLVPGEEGAAAETDKAVQTAGAEV